MASLMTPPGPEQDAMLEQNYQNTKTIISDMEKNGEIGDQS